MDRAYSIIVEDTANGTLVVWAGGVEIVREAGEWHGRSVELHRISIELLTAVVGPLTEPQASPQIERVRR
jgi:hypothetical protein